MKISDIKDIYEEMTYFDINDKSTYLRVIDLLMKNGFNWSNPVNKTKYEEYYTKANHIRLCCNRYGHKDLTYSSGPKQDNDITIDYRNYNSLYLYFNPIPNYKPRKIEREI